MGRNGVCLRRKRVDDFDDFSAFHDSQEVHVLAVDDSPVDRTVIERLLRISSCKVTSVDSGMRALQYLGLDVEKNSVGFHDLKVDLIITDYCMPGMNGYELLKKIKGSSTFRETPVVIMSSENILSRVDRCLEEGAEDFLVKPVQLSDVKRLRSYMFGEDQISDEDTRTNKRNSHEMADDLLPSLSTTISSPQSPLAPMSELLLPQSSNLSHAAAASTPSVSSLHTHSLPPIPT